MFWSLHGTTSSIDTLLASEDGFTLEQLLDEDDLLQECKSQNDKLVEFLAQPDNMSKMIDYVVDMPKESDSEARRFKFPYVSSEVLCCDLQMIRDVIFAQPHLVEKLLSILQQEPPLMPVLVGYMSKVVVALFKGSPEAFCAFFNTIWADPQPDSLMTLPKLMQRLMLHLGSDAVLQLLTVLCIGEPMMTEPGTAQQMQPLTASWIPHESLVPALFDHLGSPDPEAALNASVILNMLLESSPTLPSRFCEPESEARLHCVELVQACFTSPAAGSSSGPPGLHLPALDVLVRLLTRCREIGSTSSCAPNLIRAVADSIDSFFVALATPAQLPERIRRFLPEKVARSHPRPQAATRCKLLALFEEVLRREDSEALEALCQLGFFHVVLDILLLPHHCNALHMRTAAILDVVLSDRGAMEGDSTAKPTSSSRDALLNALLVEAQMPQRLMECATASTAMAVRPAGHAYVMVLTRALVETATREPAVAAVLEKVDGWEEFVGPEGLLVIWEGVQSTPLGGKVPQRSSDLDEDSDGDDYDTSPELERALQMQLALRAQQAEQASSASGDDGRDGDSNGAYLEHFADLLSGRDFVNDMGHNLDEVLQEEAARMGGSQWDASFDDDEFEMDESPVEMAAYEAESAAPAAPLGELLKADILDESSKATEPKAAEESLIDGFADFSMVPIPAAPMTAPAPALDNDWSAFEADFGTSAAPPTAPAAGDSGAMDLLGLNTEGSNGTHANESLADS